MKNIKKLRHPSKDQTLMAWADQINTENQLLETLFFDGEEFSIKNDITSQPPFNLIVMGAVFNAE